MDEPQPPPRPPGRRPIVTLALIIPAGLSFFGFALLKPDSWADWNTLGRFSAEQVWDGAWWAYLTAIFPHGGLMHIAFNGIMTWQLAGLIEQSRPRWLLVVLALLGAVIGSGLELLVTSTMGIGLSGVVYGCFGYLLGQQLGNRSYTIPPRMTAILLGWLVLCFPLTWMDILPIANFAHLGGLLAGFGLGACWPRPILRPWLRPLGAGLIVLLLAAAILPAIHHPFSTRYDFHRGNRAFEAEDYRAAIGWYDRVLARDPQLEEVRFNRDLARYQLGEGPLPERQP